MSKIGSDHLARSAIVYVRQSSAFQVAQTWKASGDNTLSSLSLGNSAGRKSK